MKVEFSLSHNAKFYCVHVFSALSNQRKNLRQFTMPLVLSTLLMLCTLQPTNKMYTKQMRMRQTETFASSPNPKCKVHNTSAYVANENIRQFTKPSPSRIH